MTKLQEISKNILKGACRSKKTRVHEKYWNTTNPATFHVLRHKKQLFSVLAQQKIIFDLICFIQLFISTLNYLVGQTTLISFITWRLNFVRPQLRSPELKLVSTIFYHVFISQIFIYKSLFPFKSYEKCFLFHLKSSFCSWDIQIFVFSSSPLFPPVSHYFRGWLKVNLKVYHVINCLNTNLITYFVWYLQKQKRCDIETLLIHWVLNKKHFYGKVMQKMCSKS